MKNYKPHRAVGFFITLLITCATWAYSRPASVPQSEDTKKTELSPQDDDQSVKPVKKHGEEKNKKATRRELAEEAQAFPAVLMHHMPDSHSLDLYYGAGGKEDAPNDNEHYVFLAEDMSQTQPKFDVKDNAGRRWRVKMGAEYRPETAASRLVWAAGYYVDEEYNLEELSVTGLPKLRRGRQYEHGSSVEGVRLKLQPKGEKTIGNWKWSDNPFSGTRELNGLRVMMALLNNWDLITQNNKIYEVDGQRRYLVSDLGASFGRSGNEFTRRKGNVTAYVHSRFITRITADTVDFEDHSRPLPIFFLPFGIFVHHPNYYFDLANGQLVVKNIPRADARWMGERLSQLSDAQIRDCFRAAGFSPEDVAAYANTVESRIRQLAAL